MFSVATANTHEAELLRDPDGLKPFQEREVEFLLFQEVFHMPEDEVQATLDRAGYGLVQFAGEMGLAIASKYGKSEDVWGISKIEPVNLWTPKMHERAIGRVLKPQFTRSRGMASVNIRFNNGATAGLMTTHPIVFARPRSRRAHLEAMHDELVSEYPGQSLVIGADMNHWFPRGVDEHFRRRQNLKRAELDEPTWVLHGARQAVMERIAKLSGRELDSLQPQLDSMLYRGVKLLSAEVVPIESDHRAIVASFEPPIVDSAA